MIRLNLKGFMVVLKFDLSLKFYSKRVMGTDKNEDKKETLPSGSHRKKL